MIALLGYGKTNQALLKLLNEQKTQCIVLDDCIVEEKKDERGNVFLPSVQRSKISPSLEIPSPGIPPSHPMILDSQNLVSEYDFLLKDQKQIWISGTNGKTTTTEMLEWILRDFGGASGGNIGTPLASLVAQEPKIWILETSSFSLHYTHSVFPNVYLLLPVREDHISWHGSFEAYQKAKLSPLVRMSSACTALIPREFETYDEVLQSQAKIITYESSLDLARAFGFELSKISLSEPFLLDALLALCGAKVLVGRDLSEKLADYRIGAHKIEEFYDQGGRLWVDDSKGTNVDATIWALRAYREKKIYLILGGDDKGADLHPLFEELINYDVEIFGIGSNVSKLQKLSVDFEIPFHPCFQLECAVQEISLRHSLESVALLSPAAASLDQFSSYKERGELFQKMAQVLGKSL
ncbi:UDP-N-acetylmuramoyl-L-alanine--D-glutamate ligase [Helicobacter pametensis]|uniref:UDP-N-acetylmuramoyl-L-alanine--D-glutamate ligase n=1 Tax=Helicobacter pametensis TaxID=95149 RepID=UPI000484CB9E|nr:UDP-N-acetylmuramoyl-L-alanine--D-glutamate ligase [Helicobacter pametensis]